MSTVISKLNNNLADLMKQFSDSKQNLKKTDVSMLIEENNKKIAELFIPTAPASELEQNIDPNLLAIIKLILNDTNQKTETLFKEIKERVESQSQHYDNEIFNLHKEVNELKKGKAELEQRAETAEDKVKALENEIDISKGNIDDLDQSKRNSCIVINNIAHSTTTTDEEAFIKLCTDTIRLDGTQTDTIKSNIVKVHRIKEPLHKRGTASSTKPRPLLVKFNSEKVKDLIFRKKRALRGSGIVMTEFLTPTRSALLKKCHNKITAEKSIWTDNGRILVKLHNGGDITHIANETELNNFLETKCPNIPTHV